MPSITISQTLDKVYRQLSVEKRPIFAAFKSHLQTFYNHISLIDTEEKVKGDFMDFLKMTFYGQEHKVSPNGRIDCAIHLGNNIDAPVGVIFEVKMPSNTNEMITCDNLNKKALQELLLYYLRERVEKKNFQLKYLIVTNIYEFFVFDAQEFERLFYSNKKLIIKDFNDFSSGRLASEKTDFFYKEIAAVYIASIVDKINYTHFNILDYKKALENGNDRKISELFKFISPEHLLKRRVETDSNKLNTKFYYL